MNVKIINTSGNPLPCYETSLSAGMDIRAFLTAPVVLAPLERALIPTGLYIEIPAGFEAQIRPRSGLAAKYGITVLNTPGTIDADYRGEIKVILINLSKDPYILNNGDRIAQMIIAQHAHVNLIPVTVLEVTQRGAGGFGHTGTK
ncbi:MAG: Deoxyuridine 5'-triphosphate nucleotidohydrolase [Bacteroidetes bacterium ADurb.Bin408]|nr:MAG: Deoxyuridine 5'-triphosphate nucleotidohydrolase [Bacteroidetes bacterium ADurb.Bin408]